MRFKKLFGTKRRQVFLFLVISLFFIGLFMNSMSNVSDQESNQYFFPDMVNPKSSHQEWVDYNHYVAVYGSAGDGYRIYWEFSGSNSYVGITVYAMDSSNYADFRDGYSYSYDELSDGSYYASSGNFYPSYTSTWYIVFINWDPDQQTTYLTYSGTTHSPVTNGGPNIGLIITLAVVIPAVVAIVIVVIVVTRKKAKRKAELERKPIIEAAVVKQQVVTEPVKPAAEKPPVITEPVKPAVQKPPIITEPVKPAVQKPPIITKPVKPVKTKVVFCPSCGEKVEGTFCTQCGIEIQRPPVNRENLIQDIEKVFQVSGIRIDLEMLRHILPIDDAEFNSKIFDLANRYNFKIELEILHITEEKKEEFINALIEALDV